MRHRIGFGEYTKFLESIGFRSGLTSPCNFFHKQKELFLTVHGDDFTITGRMEALSWIRREMGNKFEITANVLGQDEGMENEIRVSEPYVTQDGFGHHVRARPTPRRDHHQTAQPFRMQQERNGATQISSKTFKPSWHFSRFRQSRGIARKGQQRAHGQTR